MTGTRSIIHALALFIGVAALAHAVVDSAAASEASPRDLFNLATAHLSRGELREAEMGLQAAVATQDRTFQPLAVYNLGHVRFRQGTNALAAADKPDALRAQAGRATATGDSAGAQLARAIETPEVGAILESYFAGRGARKELRAATNAIHKALQQYGAALNRWQRASGDFKSAEELRSSADAKHNADAVDQRIAALIDQLDEMQQMQQAMNAQSQALREQMKQARSKLPEGTELPEGMSGDEEEEEDGEGQPQEMAPEQAPSRDGEEMQISPEDAMRLLETLQLDSNRKLPFGTEGQQEPNSRTGKTW